ncbi:MAG: FAD-dependent oxidoreductase [Chitinophagaceae bacterium]|nr:FAD-dependent oxidoreductase [Chitinophagaceae bacterium]
MKRDGACNSLWQDTTDRIPSDSISADGRSFDVVVVGGGITGITTGLLLQKAGKSVLIAEAQTPGFGTTGGTTAHLNTFLDTPYSVIQKKFGDKDAQLVAKSVKQALELIKNNVEQYKIDCGYKVLPGFLFSQDEDQTKELEDIIKSSHECNVHASWSEELPVNIPFKKVVKFPGQATFHPMRYLSKLLEVFQELGGVFLQDCRVTSVEEGEPHTVISTKGSFKSANLIYATHVPPGVNLLHFRCAPYRSYAIAVRLGNENEYPDSLIYDMYDPYHYYRTQEIDGELYFIAGGEDHKTGHEENTEGCFRKLEAHVRTHFNVREVANKWSSQYFEPTDGIPYIGRLPGHPENMFVATGYSGNGMVYSNVAAITLTDMILGKETDYEELYDPNRIKLVAGFSNFVKEAADVVGHLVGSLVMPAEKLNELSDLAAGEARVVSHGGHKMAIYKDEAGEVYALNSACTHIKCEVAWNGAEKTWDCPCHGSRFSYTGEMLNAPARKDLSPVEIAEKQKA